jgi:hypothetical protein
MNPQPSGLETDESYDARARRRFQRFSGGPQLFSGEGDNAVTKRYAALGATQKAQVLAFLNTL